MVMTGGTSKEPSTADSSWAAAVADADELGQAILAQGERLASLFQERDRELERRLDAVEQGMAVARAQLDDIKARLDRPPLLERAFSRTFDALATGVGKVLDHERAVIVLVAVGLFILAGWLGIVIDTPWGRVGGPDDDDAQPIAIDNDDSNDGALDAGAARDAVAPGEGFTYGEEE